MAVTLTTSYQRISTIGLTYGEIRTYAKYSSQSIANNTTTYQLKSTYYTGQAGGVSFSSATGTLDGTTRSYGYTTMYKGETTISEVSRTLTHNNDGSSPTKSVSTSWSATFGGGGSTSGSIVAPKINRYATLTSAPDFNDEGNPTINYSNPAGNSVTTLQACITTWADGEIRVPYRDISKTGTSYTFNLTEAERNTLRSMTPNSNTLSVGFWVKTITSGTTFWSSAQKTMTIVNGNPTFTHSETETNTTVSNLIGTGASTIVQNLSRIKFAITPSAKKSATIKKVELTHNNSTTSDTTSPYEFTLTPVNNSFTVKVTDSRNNVTTQTFTKTMLNYAPVKINSFSFKRNNPTGSNIIINLDAVYWNTNIGNTTNAPVVKWKMDNGSWNTIPSASVTIDNTNHKIKVTNYTLTNQLVYTSGATFYISVNDAYTSTSNNVLVTKGIPVLDLGDNEVTVNGELIMADTSENNVYKLNNIVGMFNDTSGSDWKGMLQNKINYCIDNIDTTKARAQAFINGGWSGVNYGFGMFSKINNVYQLVWFSNDYAYYCRKNTNGTYDYSVIGEPKYSTSEMPIGTWIDGKPIYRKVVNTGALPNNAEKSVAHGISNLKRVINQYGYAYRSSDGSMISLNNSTYNNLASNTYVKGANIVITTYSNRTAFAESYVVLEYTKTTD